jgi:hypothetical protein
LQCHHWPSRRASCNFCTSWHSFLMRIPCCVLHCQAHFDAFGQPLAGQYPRGHKELRGSFFRTHGPKDTIAWFSQRGVALKVLGFWFLPFKITPSREDVCQCMCFLDPEAKTTFMNRKRKTEECFLCRTVRQRSWIAFSMRPDALEVCQQLHGC